MTEDSELRMDDGSSQDRTYTRGRGIRTDGNKHLPTLMGIMLILIFAAGIFYFITNRPTARDTKGEEIIKQLQNIKKRKNIKCLALHFGEVDLNFSYYYKTCELNTKNYILCVKKHI